MTQSYCPVRFQPGNIVKFRDHLRKLKEGKVKTFFRSPTGLHLMLENNHVVHVTPQFLKDNPEKPDTTIK